MLGADAKAVRKGHVARGPGAGSLYAIGVGGGLYRVAVGVPGAPYVTVR